MLYFVVKLVMVDIMQVYC